MTEVTIFGRTYQLRGDHAPEHLRRLARVVDHKMRELAPQPASADGMKVAVLAAINFADELAKYKQCFEEREEMIGTVSVRLNAVLADCLAESFEGADGAVEGVASSLDASVQSQ